MEFKFNLEIEKLLETITKTKAETVLVQLPDGLKPKAKEIQEFIKSKLSPVKLTFWAGSCYGSCDLPKVKDLY
jgi:diphthamide biosynthesis enzyme Dph1/Dph2-like protein